MNRPPEPPPEGVLIETARREARLSVREAARRARISEGWWRQVVKGYQSLSGGGYGPVRDVPADTIARMAAAAGVGPDQLASEGERPDAAKALRELSEPGVPAGAAPGSSSRLRRLPGSGPADELGRAAKPAETLIKRRLAEVRRAGNADPSGWDMYPDDWGMALGWEKSRELGLSPDDNAEMLARALANIEQAEEHRGGRARGGRGALARTLA